MSQNNKGTEGSTFMITDPVLLAIKGLVAQLSIENQELFSKIVNAQLKSVRGETDILKKTAKLLALTYTVQELCQDED